MTEKISRDEKKRQKAFDQAIEQIRMYDKWRKQFALTSDTTGESGRARIADLRAQMEEIAAANGLNVEEVLSGKKIPRPSFEAKEKPAAKSAEKAQKAAAQAKAELSILEDSYKRNKDAAERSPDPYARMHFEGTLRGIAERIEELAEKNAWDKKEIMERLTGVSMEDMHKRGRHELEKLDLERRKHQLEVTMGIPDAREKLYEFEHRARKIVEEYDLDESHLDPFRVPDMDPNEGWEWVKDLPDTAPSFEQEHNIRISEKIPEQKRKGFFKRLFGREEKEIPNAEGNLSVDSEKEKTSSGEKDEAFTSAPKENRYQKIKNSVRKFFKVGLFTLAATGAPLQTSDLKPLPADKKIEVSTPPAQSTAVSAVKSAEKSHPSHGRTAVYPTKPAAAPAVSPALAAPRRAESVQLERLDQSPLRMLDDSAALGTPAPVSGLTSESKLEFNSLPIAPLRQMENVTTFDSSAPAPSSVAPRRTRDDLSSMQLASVRTLPDSAAVENISSGKIDISQPSTRASANPTNMEIGSLPTAPVGPMGMPVSPDTIRVAPFSPAIYSASPSESAANRKAESVPSSTTVSTGGIHVTYMDKDGNPIAPPLNKVSGIEKVPTSGPRTLPTKTTVSGVPKSVDLGKLAAPSRAPTVSPAPAAPKIEESGAVSSPVVTTVDTAGTTTTIATRIGPERYENAPAVTETAQPSQKIDTVMAQPIEQIPTSERKTGWSWSRAAQGYVSEPVITPSPSIFDTMVEAPDPEVVNLPGGYKVPHFLWERMDPNVWKALESTPAALQIYLENSRHDEAHDPYTITVWNGDKGMAYLIGSNNMLITPTAVPRERSHAGEALFGRLMVAVEDAKNGKKFSVDGRDLAAYEKLSETDKSRLAFIFASNGKDRFIDYSIDGTLGSDGTVQKIDLMRGHGYATVAARPEAIKADIQKAIDFERMHKPLQYTLRRVEKFAPGSGFASSSYWEHNYASRPKPKLVEVKNSVTTMTTAAGRNTQKRILNHHRKTKAKNRVASKKTAQTHKGGGARKQQEKKKTKTESFQVLEYN